MPSQPIFEERVKYYRLVLVIESQYLLCLQGILDTQNIGGRIEPVLQYNIRLAELDHTVKNGPHKAELVVRKVIDHIHEPWLVYRNH